MMYDFYKIFIIACFKPSEIQTFPNTSSEEDGSWLEFIDLIQYYLYLYRKHFQYLGGLP